MVTLHFENKIKELIDSLKGICASYGLGNDGNEFKIITQVFLYKFLNDKFANDIKKHDVRIKDAEVWENALKNISEEDYEMLNLKLNPDTAKLKPEHFISHLFEKQNSNNYAKLFDDTLMDIAINNNDIFSVKTEGGAKILLFDRVSEFITDISKRNDFCRAIINQLIKFSFEEMRSDKV